MSRPKKIKPLTIQSPKGMHDILPADQPLWDKIRRAVTDLADFYNFSKIETPILERAELFERTIGETTDVIEKQMFVFTSKGKERLALRPEGTAPVARSYIENGLSQLGTPLKVFYQGPMFRYEQPQFGRLREFHQFGFEIISNDDDPIYDSQIILVFLKVLESLKLRGLNVVINSIGCRNCRPDYKKKLENYYKDLKNNLCPDCKRRLEVNPLRLLDCKEAGCQGLKADAPIAVDNLCLACKNHFKKVLEYLDKLALPYNLNHELVRGLDYYTKTVFEVTAEGADFALGGGGRYDYLIELLGGKYSPAVGFAAGLERIIEVIKLQGVNLNIKQKPKVFLISLGESARKTSLTLIEDLRKAGIDVLESLGKESLKAQLRTADRAGSPLALILGQKEVFEESIIMRDLRSGVQETVPLAKLAEVIKKKK